ncbi:MAG: 50S ribosomal protein L1 [Anaerolineae bacterium]
MGKRYEAVIDKIDTERLYLPAEAISLVKETATAKFDETIEVHFRLGIDPRQADQQMRGVILMPAGLGISVRVAVFADGEAAAMARDAGADVILDEQEIANLQQTGNIDFDTAIAVPTMMPKVGRLGKLLGPRGLMPNPKSGTVVQPDDLKRVIEEARAGRVEYRNDKQGNLHVVIGKASFTEEALRTNFDAVMDEIRRARPASAKGMFIKRLVVCSTMGPPIRIDPYAALSRVE